MRLINAKIILSFLILTSASYLPFSNATAATLEVKVINDRSLLGRVSASFNSGKKYKRYGGGLLKLKRTGGDHDTSAETGIPISDEFLSMCIEINELIFFNRTVMYDITEPENAPGSGEMGSTKALHLKNLFHKVYPKFGGNIGGLAPDVTSALALQIAVWEIINETDSGFDTLLGTARFKNDQDFSKNSLAGGAISQANIWLQDLDNSGYSNLEVLSDIRFGTKRQDLIFDAPEPTSEFNIGSDHASTVPVPASLWLFVSAFGFIQLFSSRSKTTRTNSTHGCADIINGLKSLIM